MPEINSVAGQLVGIPVGQVYTAGPGIKIDNVNKVVSVDETVLWSNTSGVAPGSFPLSLSETITNFERVKFYWQTFNYPGKNHTVSEKMTDVADITLGDFIYNKSSTANFNVLWELEISNTTVNSISTKYVNWASTNPGDASSFFLMFKIVGINRIQSA